MRLISSLGGSFFADARGQTFEDRSHRGTRQADEHGGDYPRVFALEPLEDPGRVDTFHPAKSLEGESLLDFVHHEGDTFFRGDSEQGVSLLSHARALVRRKMIEDTDIFAASHGERGQEQHGLSFIERREKWMHDLP